MLQSYVLPISLHGITLHCHCQVGVNSSDNQCRIQGEEDTRDRAEEVFEARSSSPISGRNIPRSFAPSYSPSRSLTHPSVKMPTMGVQAHMTSEMGRGEGALNTDRQCDSNGCDNTKREWLSKHCRRRINVSRFFPLKS